MSLCCYAKFLNKKFIACLWIPALLTAWCNSIMSCQHFLYYEPHFFDEVRLYEQKNFKLVQKI